MKQKTTNKNLINKEICGEQIVGLSRIFLKYLLTLIPLYLIGGIIALIIVCITKNFKFIFVILGVISVAYLPYLIFLIRIILDLIFRKTNSKTLINPKPYFHQLYLASYGKYYPFFSEMFSKNPTKCLGFKESFFSRFHLYISALGYENTIGEIIAVYETIRFEYAIGFTHKDIKMEIEYFTCSRIIKDIKITYTCDEKLEQAKILIK